MKERPIPDPRSLAHLWVVRKKPREAGHRGPRPRPGARPHSLIGSALGCGPWSLDIPSPGQPSPLQVEGRGLPSSRGPGLLRGRLRVPPHLASRPLTLALPLPRAFHPWPASQSGPSSRPGAQAGPWGSQLALPTAALLGCSVDSSKHPGQWGSRPAFSPADLKQIESSIFLQKNGLFWNNKET